jgi:hypothetical protein
MSLQQAEELLQSGLPFSSERWPHDYPERIYNVHDGTLYRATPTNPGQSYHGFPELPERAKKLPREFKDRLLRLAEQKNCLAEVKKCLGN